jgi:hypothetical protein
LTENKGRNVQEIIIYIIFGASVLYIGRRSWKALTRKDCGGGCASCGGIDVDAIEKKIREESVK